MVDHGPHGCASTRWASDARTRAQSASSRGSRPNTWTRPRFRTPAAACAATVKLPVIICENEENRPSNGYHGLGALAKMPRSGVIAHRFPRLHSAPSPSSRANSLVWRTCNGQTVREAVLPPRQCLGLRAAQDGNVHRQFRLAVCWPEAVAGAHESKVGLPQMCAPAPSKIDATPLRKPPCQYRSPSIPPRPQCPSASFFRA